jgi:hypothetical protein
MLEKQNVTQSKNHEAVETDALPPTSTCLIIKSLNAKLCLHCATKIRSSGFTWFITTSINPSDLASTNGKSSIKKIIHQD